MGSIAYVTSSVPEFSTLFYEGEPSGAKIHNRVWAGIWSTGSNIFPSFLPFPDDDEEGFTNDGGGTVATHASGTTVSSGLSASATATSFTSSDGTKFRVDDVIQIESEHITISAISTNTITIQRGMLGTTAATHADTTAVSHVDAPYVTFTDWDGNLPKLNKNYSEVQIKTLNLGSGGRQYTLQYKIDEGAWKEDLADSSGNTDGIVDTSPNQTMTFPAGTTGKVLKLRAVGALTAIGTTGPQIINFSITAALRPDAMRTIPMSAYLADDLVRLNGSRRTSSNADLSQLRTWNDGAPEVQVVDPEGTTRQMVFIPGSLQVQQVGMEKYRRPEFFARFTLAEV